MEYCRCEKHGSHFFCCLHDKLQFFCEPCSMCIHINIATHELMGPNVHKTNQTEKSGVFRHTFGEASTPNFIDNEYESIILSLFFCSNKKFLFHHILLILLVYPAANF